MLAASEEAMGEPLALRLPKMRGDGFMSGGPPKKAFVGSMALLYGMCGRAGDGMGWDGYGVNWRQRCSTRRRREF